MWPEMNICGQDIHAYGIIYLGSVTVFFPLVLCHFRKLDIKRRHVFGWLLIYLASLTYFAHLFYLLVFDFDELSLKSVLNVSEGGLWGWLLAFLPLIVIYGAIFHIPLWATLETAAVSIPYPMAIHKIACLINGCCYGRPTELPWGIDFTSDYLETPLQPVQLYDFSIMVLIGLTVRYCANRDNIKPFVFPVFLVLYGLSRFETEKLRGDTLQRKFDILLGLSASQAVEIVVVLILLIMLLRRRFWTRLINYPNAY